MALTGLDSKQVSKLKRIVRLPKAGARHAALGAVAAAAADGAGGADVEEMRTASTKYRSLQRWLPPQAQIFQIQAQGQPTVALATPVVAEGQVDSKQRWGLSRFDAPRPQRARPG